MGALRCTICPETYTAQWALERHLAKPHHACPVCGALRVSVPKHISKAHKLKWTIPGDWRKRL
jgi:uncharacterized C2H2 Zn-finger protein